MENNDKNLIAENDSVTVKTKKKPLLQVPVIISLCLVVVSLLAFFAYKVFWIAEPEGVLWEYESDEGVTWYFEFKDDNTFKAYVGSSYELTAGYLKDKDGSDSILTILPTELISSSIGCFPFGIPIDYKISGSRLAGSQEMDISYTDEYYYMTGGDKDKTYTLKQAKEREEALEPDKDFVEDENLTGVWITKDSTDGAKQSYIFNDDGTMQIKMHYLYSDDIEMDLSLNCIYTVSGNQVTITMKTVKTIVEPYEYEIKDGVLYLNGELELYREGYDHSAATADEA